MLPIYISILLAGDADEIDNELNFSVVRIDLFAELEISLA